MVRLFENEDVQCLSFAMKVDSGLVWFSLIHNFKPAVLNFLTRLIFSANNKSEWPPAFVQALVLGIKAGFSAWESLQFPVGKEEQQAWMLQSLLHSTRGFARPGVAARICDEVQSLVGTMQRGRESEHFEHVIKFIDFRGSEVSLRDGTIMEGSRQVIPYPAMAWEWRCTQSYAWRSKQHINVLELVAFFNYIRSVTRIANNHSFRMLHVLDSRVVSCVVSKGRSSSIKLNRTLRRIGALLLAADIYVLPLWTISSWNFSDHGSRAVCPPRSNAG